MEENYDVFLSYKSDDVELVRPVAEALIHNGLRVWFNEYAIYDAASWSDDAALSNAIRHGAARSSSALIFCNNAWASSRWCRIELESLSARVRPERVLFIQIPDQPRYSAEANDQCAKGAQKIVYDGEVGRLLDALNGAHWCRKALQYNLPLPAIGQFDWFGKKRAKLNAFRCYLKTPGFRDAPTIDVQNLPGNVSFWLGSFRRNFLTELGGDVMRRYSATVNGVRVLLQVNYFPMQTIAPVSKLVTSSISEDRLVYKELVAHANWWVREGRGNRDPGGKLKGVHLVHPPNALVSDDSPMKGHFGATLRIDYGSRLNLVAWVRKYAFFLHQNEHTSELDMDFIFYLPKEAVAAEHSVYCGLVGYADSVVRSLELSASK